MPIIRLVEIGLVVPREDNFYKFSIYWPLIVTICYFSVNLELICKTKLHGPYQWGLLVRRTFQCLLIGWGEVSWSLCLSISPASWRQTMYILNFYSLIKNSNLCIVCCHEKRRNGIILLLGGFISNNLHAKLRILSKNLGESKISQL